jgi:autotransporter-associated beta strand protein
MFVFAAKKSVMLSVPRALIFAVAATGGFSSGQAANVSWTGGDGSFLDGSNWAGGSFPVAANNGQVSNGETATLSSGSATLTELWIGNTAAGNFVQTGGTLNLSAGVSGRGNGGVGTWTMTGGTLNTAELRVGGGTGTATTPVTSNGTMTISGASTVVNTTAFVGIGTSGTGTLTLTDSAVWTHSGDTVFLIGGDNNSSGQAGGTGTLKILNGAALSLTGGANFSIGRNTSTTTTTGNGTVVIDGGTVTLNTGTLNFGSTQGTNQLAGTGTLTVASGTLTVPNGVRFNQGNGTANFNGGVTTINGIVKVKASGTGTVNFNGGTIRAAADSTDFVSISGTTGTGTISLNILTNGLNFDTNGNAVTVAQTLSGVGGLTKLGAGTLTLSVAQAYTGNTAISAGTLSVKSAFLADSSDVSITSGGFFDLDTAGATDTIHALYVDGVAQAAGTYGAINSGATYERSYITGTGFLLVSVPEPAACGAVVAGLLGVLVVIRRRAVRP